STIAISPDANREKRRKAVRRSAGAFGQTTKASCTSPPIQRAAADRCAQSASSERHDEPGSTAEWPESERPDAKPIPSRSAGQSSSRRSSNLKPSPPSSRASERKYAQRTMCSLVVGPDDP